MGKFIDLTGQKFGKLTALYRIEDHIQPSGRHQTMWHCKCDCGNECDVRAGQLKNGKTKSCGCIKTTYKDLTGQRFGRLTVMYRADDYIRPSGQHERIWHCKCDCGNERDIYESSLKCGFTKSCGCFRNEQVHKARFEDLTGQRFGKLTVMYRVNDHIQPSGSRQTMWHCKCDCGNECNVGSTNLKFEHAISCGCIKKEISTSFNEQALFFYIKKYFPDAINSYKIKGLMEFDIYIPSKKIAIEVDGNFHNIQKVNQRDFQKNIYCLNNNIKLIRIRRNGLNSFDNCICIFNEATKSHNYKKFDDVIIKTIDLIDKTLKIDINTDRDSIEIYNSYITTEKIYNLEIAYPEIAKEWHPTKNGNLKPNMFSPKSDKKVWWKCNVCGYEWKTSIYNRVIRNADCPKCAHLKINYKISKPVICLETNQRFESITLASKIMKIYVSQISYCCKGKYKTAGGYHWKYAEKED